MGEPSRAKPGTGATDYLEGTVPAGDCPDNRLRTAVASINPMSEATQQPLEQQLEEIGTQLAWVRDYL